MLDETDDYLGGNMKAPFAIALLLVSGVSYAKSPTSIGKGQYMLSDQNITIFGSTDKIVVKLMKQAEEFCQKKDGKEAVMLESGGESAVPGQFSTNGGNQRYAKGATGTVYFQCGESETPVESAGSTDNCEKLSKLKALLDSGALTQDEYDTEKRKILGN